MKKNITIICLIIAIPISFFLGWLVCLFQSSSDTDEKSIASAVAEATSELRSDLKKAKKNQKKAENDLKEAQKDQKNDNELKEVKAELKKTKAELKKAKAESNSIYKDAFNVIFYDTGKKFVPDEADFHFYSSKFCTPDTLITKDLTFVNSRDEEGINDSGLTVFLSRSTDGPVYSAAQPFFHEIETEN